MRHPGLQRGEARIAQQVRPVHDAGQARKMGVVAGHQVQPHAVARLEGLGWRRIAVAVADPAHRAAEHGLLGDAGDQQRDGAAHHAGGDELPLPRLVAVFERG